MLFPARSRENLVEPFHEGLFDKQHQALLRDARTGRLGELVEVERDKGLDVVTFR